MANIKFTEFVDTTVVLEPENKLIFQCLLLEVVCISCFK
jgi:hypothetical protein